MDSINKKWGILWTRNRDRSDNLENELTTSKVSTATSSQYLMKLRRSIKLISRALKSDCPSLKNGAIANKRRRSFWTMLWQITIMWLRPIESKELIRLAKQLSKKMRMYSAIPQPNCTKENHLRWDRNQGLKMIMQLVCFEDSHLEWERLRSRFQKTTIAREITAMAVMILLKDREDHM
jgi:hypothetical protein